MGVWYYAQELGARVISWNVTGHEYGIHDWLSWLF